MPYLTFIEYQQLTDLSTEVTADAFKKLLPKASAVLDAETSNYYKFNDIEQDNPFRRDQFKLALCSQIEYFNDLGATTFERINSAPQTFSAGRTSVSNSSRYNPSGSNESKSLIAEDVFLYLQGTGLLYRGVR
ncbi:hypothetical protein [Alkalibacterium thalassium]|uniref:Phage gp6-like head-tail connector protein n=1 Tax=Alkalibacterium thalassium TaxID=426701 RepID=A0A1G8VPT8_9LACT|nr:hypothetical protein [Alkalibacterium thalassium]SDJ68032.1 hypothetical protein SAMN04488098_100255 [Alkalibacterium thalassium]